MDRIEELESNEKSGKTQVCELEHQIHLQEVSVVQYKNEINYLHGKVSNLKRDLEYQEKYSEKYRAENIKLVDEQSLVKQQMELKEKELQLFRKQINGLEEDNERINRLYKVVEREAFAKKVDPAANFEVNEVVKNEKADFVKEDEG